MLKFPTSGIFFKLLSVAGLGLSLTVASLGTANAGNVELRLRGNVGEIAVSSRIEPNRGGYRSSERHYSPRRHRTCSPGEAIYRAADYGIYRANIDRVDQRYVYIMGRKRGAPVKAAFYRNSSNCEVAWISPLRQSLGHYNRPDRRYGPKY